MKKFKKLVALSLAVAITALSNQAPISATVASGEMAVELPLAGRTSKNIAVSGITFDKYTMTLTAGGTTGTLKATVSPLNATNKNITWSSSNSSVAKVSNGIVTPLSAGTAVITAASSDGLKKTSCTVKVNPAPAPTTPAPTPAPAPAPAPAPVPSEITKPTNYTINAMDYGAKIDGITDDTKAIQAAINALPDGGTFILPYGQTGVSRVTQINFSSKKNCSLYFDSSIKLKDSIVTPYGIVVAGGENNNFYNLNIDGNRANSIDGGKPGVTASLVLAGGSRNLQFLNMSIYESIWTACIFNGKADSIAFKGFTLKNTGEHGFYVSGGSNNNVTWENGYIENINLNPNNLSIYHESYFIKSASGTYGNNSNFNIKNIKQVQPTAPVRKAMFMCSYYLNSSYAENISLGSKVNGIVINDYTGQIIFNNLTNTDGIMMYNSNNTAHDIDIQFKNSRIYGYQPNFNNARLYENCYLQIESGDWTTADLSNRINSKVILKGCQIAPKQKNISLINVTNDIEFIDCNIKSIAQTSTGSGFIKVGSTSYTSGKNIKFSNCQIDLTNYSDFIGVYNTNTKLSIENSTINRGIKNYVASMDTLNIKNVYFNTIDSNSLKYVSAANIILAGVYVDGVMIY